MGRVKGLATWTGRGAPHRFKNKDQGTSFAKFIQIPSLKHLGPGVQVQRLQAFFFFICLVLSPA